MAGASGRVLWRALQRNRVALDARSALCTTSRSNMAMLSKWPARARHIKSTLGVEARECQRTKRWRRTNGTPHFPMWRDGKCFTWVCATKLELSHVCSSNPAVPLPSPLKTKHAPTLAVRRAHVACLQSTQRGRVSPPGRAKPPRARLKKCAATPSVPTRSWHGRHQAHPARQAASSRLYMHEWQLSEGVAALPHPGCAPRGASALI